MTRAPSARPFHVMEALAIVCSLLLISLAFARPGAAQSADLSGSWRGSGSVAFASGQSERAQCRANYSRTSSRSYALRATCATASGRASQTATLRYVGGNRYQGNFYNREYDVSGTINVAVNGNRQLVRLSSDSGSATFEMRR
jgi:hypothetical protein